MRFSKFLLFALLGIAPTLSQAALISLVNNSTATFTASASNGGTTSSAFPNNALVSSGTPNTITTDINFLIASVNTTVRITMTGWDINTAVPSDTWTRRTLANYSTGLGVCGGGDADCNDPNHRVDNNGFIEGVLFQFSSRPASSSGAFSPFSLDVNQFFLSSRSTDDNDVSFWARNFSNPATTLTNLDGWTLAQTQANWGLNLNNDSPNSALGNRIANIPDNFSNTFFLTGRIGHNDDYFKIRGLDVVFNSPPTTPGNDPGVPEPSTYATLGAALLALGYYRRKSGK